MTQNTAEQKQMTLGDVQGMLEKLQFKNVLKPTIVSAGKVTNGRFKEALLNATAKQEGFDENVRYIASCLCLATRPTLDFLAKNNLPINHDQLVELGIKKGIEIRGLIKNYLETGDVTFFNQIRIAFGQTELSDEQIDIHVADASNINSVTSQHQQPQPSEEMEPRVNAPDDNEREQGGQRTEFRSVHFYGKDTALCFGASQTRGDKAHTINLDAAKSKGSAERSFDWKSAIHFQFTPKELIGILSVFMNLKKMVEYKSHGAQNDKGFSIERQENGYYMKLFSKQGGARGVPVGREDAVALAFLVIDQIVANNPDYKKPDLLNLVKMVLA